MMDGLTIDPLLLILKSLEKLGFEWIPVFFTLSELWAIYLALHSIRRARTSQGAVAWSVALISMPLISIPLYLIAGRSKFVGHVDFRRKVGFEVAPALKRFKSSVEKVVSDPEILNDNDRAMSELAHLPWLKGNTCKLLINGTQTFNELFKAMDNAKEYILHQYFIIEDNELGHIFSKKCQEAAKRGIKVYLIYDAIGCYGVDELYWTEMKEAGVEVMPFHIMEKRTTRLQINFRNHRKISVIDGDVGFFGGHNIGDSYIGKREGFSPWRDTHVLLKGPSVLALQLCFLEDWYFVNSQSTTDKLPQLKWDWEDSWCGESDILILPSGPADDFETCGLMFNSAIHQARERFWLASPYFIPDGKIRSALITAALKGVDVRILLPKVPDHKMVYFARQDFYEGLQNAGVKFYLFEEGFLHEKVFLVDDNLAAVGTANLDNRSFRLNFELTGLVKDKGFIAELAQMLENDFSHSELLPPFKLDDQALWKQLLIRGCRLFSPIL